MKKDFSTEVEEKAGKVLEGVEEKYLGKVCRREVANKVYTLSSMAAVMAEHLKRDNNYDPAIENAIKHVVATCMEKGVRIGKRYDGSPEELMRIIEFVRIHPTKIIEGLPKKKQKLAKYILHSLLLGKLSYETGLAISATLSKSQRGKYLKQLEEETSQYIR